jgi:ethanolamine kinase
VLATFENGRVEGFLDMRTLQPVDMTEASMAARIARRLKQFHRSNVSLPGVDAGQSELYPTIWKWCGALFPLAWPASILPRPFASMQVLCRLDMARSIQYDDAAKQAAQEGIDFDGMAAELRLTEDCCSRLDAPVVWSHNDLLSGNVLVSHKVLLLAGVVLCRASEDSHGHEALPT